MEPSWNTCKGARLVAEKVQQVLGTLTPSLHRSPAQLFTSRREHQQLIVARCACTHPGGIALRGFGELPSTRASFFPRTPSLTFCVILDAPCAHRTYLPTRRSTVHRPHPCQCGQPFALAPRSPRVCRVWRILVLAGRRLDDV